MFQTLNISIPSLKEISKVINLISAIADSYLNEELPDTYRLPIIRSEIGGKTQREVAAELKLSLPQLNPGSLEGVKSSKILYQSPNSQWFSGCSSISWR